ncbi:Uncharacterised protein [Serratia grimesii]|jgi:hypothetical protein|nr:Uncharacterised protein [Serratia grimesii]CAI0907575.1 Uncharacterised protein [Serratia grimesii]CAI2413596.1 Uncharacterised protein [Serratia grimesii]SUI35206.1 Uncharacterised protein [Serratia grimesii]
MPRPELGTYVYTPYIKIVTTLHKVLPCRADNSVNQRNQGLSARAFNKGKHV